MIKKWGSYIKHLREVRGMTQEDLAKKSHADITRDNIAQIETGRVKNIPPYIENILNALDINPIDFFSKVYDSKQTEPLPIDRALSNIKAQITELEGRVQSVDTVNIPILGSAPAGTLCVEEEFAEGYIKIDKKDLIGVSKIDDVFAVRVKGASLIGDGIHDGYIALVDPNAAFVEGKIYVCEIENECVIKHVFKDKDKVRLISSNSEYKDYLVSEVRIKGRVFKSYPPPLTH